MPIMAEAQNNNTVSTVVLVILAIFLPPLAVFLDGDGLNGQFWLNVVLCIFFWVPGVLHALFCVLREKEPDEAGAQVGQR
jgi:uncharacterized membrane protein YqaE (UPF0057 family)